VMSDDKPKHTDVNVSGPAVVEIDAERIAQIVLDVTRTSATNAAKAANRIIELLAEVFQAADGLQ
jgi:hypothetical protein